MKHFCLIPDENDNCTECGQHIDLPDVGELPDLGDLVGICRLIDETAAECFKLGPRQRAQKVLRAYKKAKALGYRGDLLRWIEFVDERMTN